MEVILLENVENLGSVGDKVSVKSGFARNYLVPHGKAQMATAANIAEFEARRAELENAAAEALQAAEDRKQAIEAAKEVFPFEFFNRFDDVITYRALSRNDCRVILQRMLNDVYNIIGEE